MKPSFPTPVHPAYTTTAPNSLSSLPHCRLFEGQDQVLGISSVISILHSTQQILCKHGSFWNMGKYHRGHIISLLSTQPPVHPDRSIIPRSNLFTIPCKAQLLVLPFTMCSQEELPVSRSCNYSKWPADLSSISGHLVFLHGTHPLRLQLTIPHFPFGHAPFLYCVVPMKMTIVSSLRVRQGWDGFMKEASVSLLHPRYPLLVQDGHQTQLIGYKEIFTRTSLLQWIPIFEG